MTDRDRWARHITAVRASHGLGILDTERLALADEQWRRWVLHQINSDEGCRRLALRHIRYNGNAALIQRDGDRLVIR